MTTYSGTPRTWTAGELVTAALMNANVRDPLLALTGAWNSYVPTWSPGTPAIGDGTLEGRYIQVGKLVMFRIHLLGGSTTSWGGSSDPYQFTLPSAAAAPYIGSQFSGAIYDNTIGYRPLSAILIDDDSIALYTDPTTAGNQMRAVHAASPQNFAVSDRISVSGVYEAA